MDFRVLGPLEVESGGSVVPIKGAKERALLALLLLRANRLVSRDLLIDELWGEHPPATAKHTLEAYVSRLRRALAAGGNGRLLESQPGGYRIRVEGDELDVLRFERLLKEGRSALASGALEQAEEKLAIALALWRGPVLADLAFEPFAEAEARRLEELRLVGVEARLEAALALGRDAELVGELQSLVAAYPLHERLRAQLMLALYRSGRQAEALAAYRDGRRRLVDELGIEPSRELQELEGAILRQEPQLQPPPEVAESVSPAPPVTRRRRARPALPKPALLAVAAAGAAVVALGAVALSGGSSSPAKIGPTSIGVIDPQTNRVTAEIPLGFKSSLIAAGEGHIWVVDPRGATLRKINPRTREVTTIGIAAGAGAVPFGIAVGRGAVWLALLRGTRQVLLELGADIGEPRRTRAFGERGRVLSAGLHPLAVDRRAVWALDSLVGGVWRIELRGSKETKVTDGLDARALTVAGGAVWVAGASTVTKIDAATGVKLGATSVGTASAAETSSIAVGRNGVWFAASSGHSVARIDPESVAPTETFPVGLGPSSIALGEGAVWVANSREGTISRLDPRNGERTTIRLGQAPGGVVAAYGAVWTSPGEPRS